jgi:hypothetical protein
METMYAVASGCLHWVASAYKEKPKPEEAEGKSNTSAASGEAIFRYSEPSQNS